MRTVDFLDAVKRRHALPSDYAISKLFGWRIQRIYEYRHSGRELDDEACVQIATALDLPPPYVMACIAAARAKDATIKKYWLSAATLLKKNAAAAVATVALALSQSAPSSGPQASVDGFNNLYIMRRKRHAVTVTPSRPWKHPRRRVLHPVTARTDLVACGT